MRNFSRFESLADVYDRNYRHVVPFYDEMHQNLIQIMNIVLKPDARIMDLGCGTGEVGRRSLIFMPDAKWILVDGAQSMIERAKAVLVGRVESSLVCDFTDCHIWETIDGLDAVVSTFTIHYLQDEDKKRLFKKVAAVLKPSGIFLIGDMVKVRGGTEAGIYQALVKRNMERNLRDGLLEPGFCERELYRPPGDEWEERPAWLDEQLSWLSEAGFETFQVWRHLGVALFGGANPRER